MRTKSIHQIYLKKTKNTDKEITFIGEYFNQIYASKSHIRFRLG